MQDRVLDVTSKAKDGVPALSFRSRLVLGNPSAPLFPSLCTRDSDPTYRLPTDPRLRRGSKRRGDYKAEQRLASEPPEKEEVSTLEPATGFLPSRLPATGLT